MKNLTEKERILSHILPHLLNLSYIQIIAIKRKKINEKNHKQLIKK